MVVVCDSLCVCVHVCVYVVCVYVCVHVCGWATCLFCRRSGRQSIIIIRNYEIQSVRTAPIKTLQPTTDIISWWRHRLHRVHLQIHATWCKYAWAIVYDILSKINLNANFGIIKGTSWYHVETNTQHVGSHMQTPSCHQVVQNPFLWRHMSPIIEKGGYIHTAPLLILQLFL